MSGFSKYHAEGEVPFCGSVRSSGGGAIPVECEHEDPDDPDELDVDEGPEDASENSKTNIPEDARNVPEHDESPSQGPEALPALPV